MRHATVDDVSILTDLFRETSAFYDLPVSAPDMVSAHLRAFVLGPDATSKVLIAFSGEEPVGYATYAVMYPAPNLTGQLYMKELFVRESHRAGGIGRWMMGEVAKRAVSLGCSRFDWTSEVTNPKAMSFYGRIGAHMLEEKRYFRIDGKDLLRFAEEDQA